MDWWQWLNFFLQTVCSSSWERGRSSFHSSMSTTTPPCESASWYLYSTHLNPSEPIFPLRFPLWWIGAKYVAGGSSFLVTRHYDHWSATNHPDWSGRLLQLLCPCDHVLLLCPFHSGGQRQVVFFGDYELDCNVEEIKDGGMHDINGWENCVDKKSYPGRTCGGRSTWQYYRCLNFTLFVKKSVTQRYNLLPVSVTVSSCRYI